MPPPELPSAGASPMRGPVLSDVLEQTETTSNNRSDNVTSQAYSKDYHDVLFASLQAKQVERVVNIDHFDKQRVI